MGFISSKARVQGHLEGDNVILGPTMIGKGSILGKNVIIGCLAKGGLKAFRFPEGFTIGDYDSVSQGAKIGKSCIIRSGTVIYETVTIADEVETGHNVLIREGSVVGEGTLIGSSTQLDGTVKVGRNVRIQSNVYLPHLTVLEDEVFIAPGVYFTNDPYPPSGRLAGVVVERDAIIGAKACILAGIRIGEGAVVGMGAVVTRDVPAKTVVLGIPARHHMTREEYDGKKSRWARAS